MSCPGFRSPVFRSKPAASYTHDRQPLRCALPPKISSNRTPDLSRGKKKKRRHENLPARRPSISSDVAGLSTETCLESPLFAKRRDALNPATNHARASCLSTQTLQRLHAMPCQPCPSFFFFFFLPFCNVGWPPTIQAAREQPSLRQVHHAVSPPTTACLHGLVSPPPLYPRSLPPFPSSGLVFSSFFLFFSGPRITHPKPQQPVAVFVCSDSPSSVA